MIESNVLVTANYSPESSRFLVRAKYAFTDTEISLRVPRDFAKNWMDDITDAARRGLQDLKQTVGQQYISHEDALYAGNGGVFLLARLARP